MNQPRFQSELEVTKALANREIDGVSALEYYREAVAWQKYLKTLQPKFYRRPSNRPVKWTNYRPGYASKKDEE